MASLGDMSEMAFAKVNLALHVRTRRSDGYHELDTIFAFIDDGDQLHAKLANNLSLNISGPFAAGLTTGSENLVLRSALKMQSYFNIDKGASLHLQKNLPIASGIGGGSADAAAAARVLNKLWKIGAEDNDLCALLAPLGADIPACVASHLVRGKGTGTDLIQLSINPLSGSAILLVNPMQPVSTAAVFSAWDGQDKGGLQETDLLEMIQLGRNDLQDAALKICPDIELILRGLQRFEPQLARMSGSGATCFAIFSDLAKSEAAQHYFTSEYPAYWSMAGKIR